MICIMTPLGEKTVKGTFARQICVYVSVCVVWWLELAEWQVASGNVDVQAATVHRYTENPEGVLPLCITASTPSEYAPRTHKYFYQTK